MYNQNFLIRSSRKKNKSISQINVTPFVDVMLVLLIVFMITAPLLTVGVSVDLPKTKVVTKSAERSIPSWLSKVVESEKVNDGSRTRATVDEECPKCGNPIVEFYTMQMRSVDEGQTVFYECPKCGYTWSQNN